MARLDPPPPENLAELATELSMAAEAMGFEANSLKIMAHRPHILRGFLAMMGGVFGPDAKLQPALAQMIAYIASTAAGCRYCQAHTAEGAHRRAVSDDKIAALWNYQTDPQFSAAERAALSLAQAAANVPNNASDDHFAALKKHFDTEQIAEIVALISAFGFLNRWNDTLATDLEDSPLAFAQAHLAKNGWTRGNH